MEGGFIMNGTEMPMTAQQILAPPAQGFVWRAAVGSGFMRFAGSDGYHVPGEGTVDSWTKFWLRGLIPLARVGRTDDHARAAATRVMMESIWAPASLLPQSGAQWSQTGPDTAEVRFADAPDLAPMLFTFDAEGDAVEVTSLRWTDANPGKIYRLQPFGRRILETGIIQGFRTPSASRWETCSAHRIMPPSSSPGQRAQNSDWPGAGSVAVQQRRKNTWKTHQTCSEPPSIHSEWVHNCAHFESRHAVTAHAIICAQ